MKQTYAFVQYERIQLLREREALILIALTEAEEFILECYVSQGNFFVDFFSDQLRALEDPQTCALRLLEERSIAWRDFRMLAPIHPLHGDVERIYICVARGCDVPVDHPFLICDLALLLKYMEMNVFTSPEGKKALMQYLDI